MKKKIFLNLGGGNLPIKGAINVDWHKTKYVDEVVDLTKLPWKWPDKSVDGIYLVHVLEHLAEPIKILKECHRILKLGGFLYIQVPHSSNVCAAGDITHYRTFSYPTLANLLTQPNWLIPKQLFTTELLQLVWWDTRHRKHPYLDLIYNDFVSKRPRFDKFVLIPVSHLIQKLIDLSPSFFERFWCYFVGGADEVIWKGRKI
jgi:SAM-dependent methyltransferase